MKIEKLEDFKRIPSSYVKTKGCLLEVDERTTPWKQIMISLLFESSLFYANIIVRNQKEKLVIKTNPNRKYSLCIEDVKSRLKKEWFRALKS